MDLKRFFNELEQSFAFHQNYSYDKVGANYKRTFFYVKELKEIRTREENVFYGMVYCTKHTGSWGAFTFITYPIC